MSDRPCSSSYPMYACLCRPDPHARSVSVATIADAFSPRYEMHSVDLVSIDISGLERLFGTPEAIGTELSREAIVRGVHIQIALAATRTAALILAQARPGVTIIGPGQESDALAPLPIDVLETIASETEMPAVESARLRSRKRPVPGRSKADVSMFKAWGLRTLGELAALPAADLVARLGRHAVMWQALARGVDIRPLVPTVPDERFESAFELEWPVDELEPLSFVLTRLLEPLSIRLERRDRGVAVLHVVLGLVTREVYARRLQLPTPIRDVRALRTLVLLDLESHPPPAAIERVAIVIDPTPGRVLQHTLYARPHPTPEALSTLLARLGALMGQDRIGVAAVVDSYRPGAFAMHPFATLHQPSSGRSQPPCERLVSAWRCYRQPVPARVVVSENRPIRVSTDRRGLTGGTVLMAAGPWRTSGDWWNPREALEASPRSGSPGAGERRRNLTNSSHAWSRVDWDVALDDGGVYRVYHDRLTNGWFIDAVVD